MAQLPERPAQPEAIQAKVRMAEFQVPFRKVAFLPDLTERELRGEGQMEVFHLVLLAEDCWVHNWHKSDPKMLLLLDIYPWRLDAGLIKSLHIYVKKIMPDVLFFYKTNISCIFQFLSGFV